MIPKYTDFSALLLDFDGTLVNTEPLHEKALQEFFASKGFVFGKKEAGKSTIHVFEDWGEENKESERAQKYLAEYLEKLPPFLKKHSGHLNWYPDAKTLLEATTEFPRALVTGSFWEWVEAFDKKLKVFSRFPHTVTKDDLLPDNEKPKPYSYQLAAQQLGLKPEQCLAVEDSRVGIKSAKAAGCFVVAINRNTTDTDFSAADQEVQSLTELLP